MIIDTSVLLAIFFDETHGAWAAQVIAQSPSIPRMSTVNLTETLILLEDRQPKRFKSLRKKLLNSGIEFVAPDVKQSTLAASARLKYPLNLGDCFAYALSKLHECPLLTLDHDFQKTDCQLHAFP